MPTIFSRGAASALALGFGKVSSILTDSFFKYVTLLLPGNGTNAAQNNTFLDSSSNNFTITRNGNTTQGTFSPYGSNWSMNTSVTGSYLTIPQNTAFAFGTGDFTIEAWVMRNEGSRQQGIVDTRGAGSGAVGVLFYLTAQGYLAAFDGTSTYIGGSVATVMPGYQANGLWTHVAITRSGTTTRLFINGTIVATLAGDTRNYANGASGTLIARQFGSTANDWIGWISNVRIVKGTALYTATFTPSTTPLTAVSGTSLLTCQSNRFVDNSGNNFTVTPTGTPRVQRYSPFSPTASYSAATVGGSGYFDGSGDSLTAANNVALQLGSTYTAEAWVYPTAYGANLRVWTDGSAGVNNVDLYVTSTGVIGVAGGSATVSGYTLPLNSWTHIALVVNAGALAIYVNGTSRTLAGTTTGYNSNSTSTRYFGSFSSAGYDWPGYISDIRFVKGTAVYTATFTPPTSPLTAISGTSILLNMQNAGIIDNAMMTDLETVGNAQISTAQSKWGGSSILFDGTDDRLVMPSSATFGMGAGDFTIEGWFYYTGSVPTGDRGFLQISNVAGGLSTTYTTGIIIYVTNAGSKLGVNVAGTSIIGATTISANTWVYFAVTRASGTCRIFVNGTLDASGSATGNMTGTNLCVGGYYSTAYLWIGYLDDIRITRGYARYTATFTPPTEAFPTL